MLFTTHCPNCQIENRVEFADTNIHEITCRRCSQKYCVFVRKQRFEVLFDLGTRALVDGYAREAVASFAASLERFMEFYVRAYTLELSSDQGIDFAEAEYRLNRTWRHVISQSERQVGMFALAYLLRESEEPDFLVPKSMGTDFRNKVIHRGYLPRRAEVDQYAAKVFALIDRLLNRLGTTAGHAELLQERQFAEHLESLADDVVAVFEEHPGMFRARRFGTLGSSIRKTISGSQSAGSKPLNDAQMFQKALKERGKLLENLK